MGLRGGGGGSTPPPPPPPTPSPDSGGSPESAVLSSVLRLLGFNTTNLYKAIVGSLVFEANMIPITIDSNGAIIVTQSTHIVAANSGTTDNLDTVTWFDGTQLFLILWADTGDTITVRHGIDNIFCWGDSDITMDENSPVILIQNLSTGNWVALGDSFSSSSHAQSHALLNSTNHNDTSTDSVTRGSLIYGNATPAWDELVVGTTGQYLGTDGTDALWRAQSTLDHGSIGGLTDDDHTQYRLESVDHTHQSTGAEAGKIDHGAALNGLTDDDHTQYILADGSRAFTTHAVIGSADTSGVRADLESGDLAIREGDDSAYAGLRALHYIVGAATTSGIRLDVSAGILRVREGDNSAFASIAPLNVSAQGSVSATTTLGASGATTLGAALTLTPATSADIDANDEITATITTAVLRITCSGASDSLSGLTQGTADGQVVFLRPASGKDITLVHDGTVVSGKKLMINGEDDVVLDQDHDIAIAIWDNNLDVWHVMVPGSGGAGGGDEIVDADGDTKIQAEESADEDILRFDTAGTERMQITAAGDILLASGTDIQDSGGTSRIKLATSNPHVEIDDNLRVETIGIGVAPSASSVPLTVGGAGTGAGISVVTTATSTAVSITSSLTGSGFDGVAISPTVVLNANSAGYRGLVSNAGPNTLTNGLTGLSAQGMNFTVTATIQASNITLDSTYATLAGIVTSPRAVSVATGASGVGTNRVTNMYGLQVDPQLITSQAAGGAATVIVTNYYGILLEAPSQAGAGTETLTNYYGIRIENTTGITPATINYLMEIGDATNPYLRVIGGAAPGAGLTNIYASVNGTLRRLQTMDPGAAGANFAGGEAVAIFV